jgi:hypothetical protein
VITSEVLDISLLLHGVQEKAGAGASDERRKRVREPTFEERAELARYWGRLIQMFLLVGLIAAGAMLLGSFVFEVIHKPFQQGAKALETATVSVALPKTQ